MLTVKGGEYQAQHCLTNSQKETKQKYKGVEHPWKKYGIWDLLITKVNMLE